MLTPEQKQKLREAMLAKYQQAQDNTAVQEAQDSSDTTNLVSGIGEALSTAANANAMSRGGQAPDLSMYQNLRDQARQRIKDAVEARQGKIAAAKGEMEMQQGFNAEDRADEGLKLNQDQFGLSKEQFAHTKDQAGIQNKFNQDKMAQDTSQFDQTMAFNRQKNAQDAGFKQQELGQRDRELDFKGKELDQRLSTPPKTKGQEAADIEFGRRYAEYKSGGFAKGEENLKKLEGVIAEIGKVNAKGDNLQSRWTGAMPLGARAIFDQDSVRIQQNVESVAQEAMKEILGAQFAQKEGQELLKRTWNPQLPTAENVKNVQGLVSKLRQANQAMKSMSDHFEKTGSISGYSEGPTLDDSEARRKRLEELRRKNAGQ
jgi:hypothetical protein